MATAMICCSNSAMSGRTDGATLFLGVVVGDATGAAVLTGGFISLQSESHPCDFRKIEIQKLGAK